MCSQVVWCLHANLTMVDAMLCVRLCIHSLETISLHFCNTFTMPDAFKILHIWYFQGMLSSNFKVEWVIILPPGSYITGIPDDEELKRLCALWMILILKKDYRKLHRLSTSMLPFCICVVVNLPPSSADVFLYNWYPSFSAYIQFIIAYIDEMHLY